MMPTTVQTIKMHVGYACEPCAIWTKTTEISICPRRFHKMTPIYRDVPVKEPK